MCVSHVCLYVCVHVSALCVFVCLFSCEWFVCVRACMCILLYVYICVCVSCVFMCVFYHYISISLPVSWTSSLKILYVFVCVFHVCSRAFSIVIFPFRFLFQGPQAWKYSSGFWGKYREIFLYPLSLSSLNHLSLLSLQNVIPSLNNLFFESINDASSILMLILVYRVISHSLTSVCVKKISRDGRPHLLSVGHLK